MRIDRWHCVPRWLLFRAVEGLVLSDDLRICFSSYDVLSSVSVPDGVLELCGGCFKGYRLEQYR